MKSLFSKLKFWAKIFAVVFVTIFLPLASEANHKNPPSIITFQGRLLDNQNVPIGGTAGTDLCFRFSFYDDPTAGIKLWPSGTPSAVKINIKEGILNAFVGDTANGGDVLSPSVLENNLVYINTEIGTPQGNSCAANNIIFSNLNPRHRVLTSPSTFNALKLSGHSANSNPVADEIPILDSNGNLTFNGGVNADFVSTMSSLSVGTATQLNGTLSINGISAPTISPFGQGRIYFDSTLNKFRVSQNGLTYTDLVGGGGAGTVTSVGLSLPSDFSVINSPITTSGSFGVTWNDQSVNKFLAGPVTGLATTPTFRPLTDTDIPDNITLTNLTQITTRLLTDMNGVLPPTKGGTGLSTYTTGDLIYSDAANSLAKLPIDADSSKFLGIDVTGVPLWKNLPPVGTGDISGTGIIDRLPVFTGVKTISNSILSQAGGNLNILSGDFQLGGTNRITNAGAGNLTSLSFSASTLPAGGISFGGDTNLYRSAIGNLKTDNNLEISGTLRVSGGSPGVGKVLTSDAIGLASWQTPAAGGTGTVTSVGLSLPSIFNVVGSPITTAGTITGTLINQTANTILSGPVTGLPGIPNFRLLTDADIPDNITLTNITQITNRAISDTTGILAPTRGGTGLSTYATGDVIYSDAANSLGKLSIGTTDQVLTVDATGIPTWKTLTAGGGSGWVDNGTIVNLTTPSDQVTIGMGPTIGKLNVNNDNPNNNALFINAPSNQATDIIRVDVAGGPKLLLKNDGQFLVGGRARIGTLGLGGAGPQLYVWTDAVSTPGIIIRGFSGQTASLQEWSNFAGNTLSLVDSAGRFQIPAGSSAATGLGFFNDNDTGLFSPSNNTLALSTGGSERLRVDNNGLEISGQLKITGGSPGVGKVLTSDAIGLASWQTPVGAVGTVTSVGLTTPSEFTVTNSPITNSGDINFSWTNQIANQILSGPASGLPGAPSFRALTDTDIPDNITLTNLTQITTRLLTDMNGVLPPTKGGTGLSTYTTGDIIFSDAANSLGKLSIGTTDQVLTVDATGIPTWKTLTASGDISGTGIIDRLPVFAGVKTLTNSILSQAGGNLNILSGGLQIGGVFRINNAGSSFFTSEQLSGPLMVDGVTALSQTVSPLGSGKIYFDSTLNKFRASENGLAYVNLISGGGGGISGAGATGQATFWTGAGAISGDNGFFWDNINKRLGLGTIAPPAKLSLAASTVSTDGIFFGADTNLYRSGANNLKTDSNLEIGGTLKINGGAPGAGKVLTSDALGLASWQTPAAGGATTLQQAYSNDVDGGDTVISLTSADGSLVISNPVSGGSNSTSLLALNQLASANTLNILSVQNLGTGIVNSAIDINGTGLIGNAIAIEGPGAVTTGIAILKGGLMNSGISFNAPMIAGISFEGTASVATAINIANPNVTTDIRLQNGATIDNNTSGNIKLTASTVQATGIIRQGNAINCSLKTDASGNLICTSDEQLKDIQGNYEGGLSQLLQINPIRFNYKGESYKHVGFSAQNVGSVLPEGAPKQTDGSLGLDSDAMLALIVNSLKELATKSGGSSDSFWFKDSAANELKPKLGEKLALESGEVRLASVNPVIKFEAQVPQVALEKIPSLAQTKLENINSKQQTASVFGNFLGGLFSSADRSVDRGSLLAQVSGGGTVIGPKNGVTAITRAGGGSSYIGGVSWGIPNNAIIQDNNYTTASIDKATYTGNTHSNYLVVENFGFNIPSTATITGIKVEIDKKASATNSISDYRIELFDDSTVAGHIAISPDKSNKTFWPITDTNNYVVYGGPDDLWGLASISPSVVNNPYFSIGLAAQNSAFVPVTASVDHLRVTVYYGSAAPPPTGDTTFPSVSITAPIAGATVSNTIVVSANAADNVGVVGVQFKLDGNNLSIEDIASPYSISWDTKTASNGSHVLTAVARDVAGNIATSAGVNITVSNLSPPPSATQCADGIDNDGDSKIDFPADPGCTDANDNDETDLPPPPPTGTLTINWSMGADSNDKGNFKISNSGALGTSDRLVIDDKGTVLPGADNVQDLGSPTKRWHSLYVGPGTVHIGNLELGESNDNLTIGSTNRQLLITSDGISWREKNQTDNALKLGINKNLISDEGEWKEISRLDPQAVKKLQTENLALTARVSGLEEKLELLLKQKKETTDDSICRGQVVGPIAASEYSQQTDSSNGGEQAKWTIKEDSGFAASNYFNVGIDTQFLIAKFNNINLPSGVKNLSLQPIISAKVEGKTKLEISLVSLYNLKTQQLIGVNFADDYPVKPVLSPDPFNFTFGSTNNKAGISSDELVKLIQQNQLGIVTKYSNKGGLENSAKAFVTISLKPYYETGTKCVDKNVKVLVLKEAPPPPPYTVPGQQIPRPAGGGTTAGSSGATSGGTFANSGAGLAWTSPGNASASDDSYASVSSLVLAGTPSKALVATNFSFSIPSGATISGVVVEIERNGSGAGTVIDTTVKLYKGGVASGNDKAVATTWPSSDAYATYGSASDLWGNTLTPSDVNASNFGVGIGVQGNTDTLAGTASIDHVRITVSYTTGSGSVGSGSVLETLGSLMSDLWQKIISLIKIW